MSISSYISGSEIARLLWRVILPVLTAAALIAAFNMYLGGLGFKPRLICWGKCYDEYDVIYTNAVKAKENGKRIVVFIGDSRIEWGLDPDEIQAVLERNGIQNTEVFNLAIPGRNVRTMLAQLNDVGFYPDVLVVGYSHLSFYWSKNYVDHKPRRLGWWESDLIRVRSLVRRTVLMWPISVPEVWKGLSQGVIPSPDLGSWLDSTGITPRGQSIVHYRIPEAEAVAFQKKFYSAMYQVEMTDKTISDVNAEFLKDISVQREHGTKVLLLKMPLSGWALDLEKSNERTGLADLAGYLKTPFLDGNTVPGAAGLQTFDGLHLAPSAAPEFARWLGEKFILPNLPK